MTLLAANATTRLNITTTLDAVRTGPAELLQQMLTLASATPARSRCSPRPAVGRHRHPHADGFVSMVPSAFVSPDQWGTQVQEMRAQLERKGRDPQVFTCGFWPFVLVYRNDDQRERLLTNPITKWMTAVFGRLHHGDWKSEGIDLIFPEDWHYALRMLPHQMSQAEVDDMVARVTPAMVEKSWLIGTPEEIAAQLRPCVEAGADFIAPSELAPAIMEPEEQPEAFKTMIELCTHLHADNAAAIAAGRPNIAARPRTTCGALRPVAPRRRVTESMPPVDPIRCAPRPRAVRCRNRLGCWWPAWWPSSK